MLRCGFGEDRTDELPLVFVHKRVSVTVKGSTVLVLDTRLALSPKPHNAEGGELPCRGVNTTLWAWASGGIRAQCWLSVDSVLAGITSCLPGWRYSASQFWVTRQYFNPRLICGCFRVSDGTCAARTP